jgi:hypothetical protein
MVMASKGENVYVSPQHIELRCYMVQGKQSWQLPGKLFLEVFKPQGDVARA